MRTNHNSKAAVVTGCTGAVGIALLQALAAGGYTVYAVLRPDSPRNAAIPQHEAIVPVLCDLRDIRDLPARIPAPCDSFFHLAWGGTTGSARNDMHLQLQNTEAALQAAEAAHALGCRIFVGAGSQAEYGRTNVPLTPERGTFPENGYGMAKLCAGQMTRKLCDAFGMTHIWMRILSVYGAHDGAGTMGMSVLRALLSGDTPECTAGEQIWDYLYSEDAARALLLAAETCTRSAVYCLGSGEARALRDYITDMRDAVDPLRPVAFGARAHAPDQVMYLTADLTALTRDTGFIPQVSFHDGIRRTLAWLTSGKENNNETKAG
ncbi:MAG: NAD(P)-dependent oxidoreductase [Oscillospiraceae bacterium]|nr:NAD(P)-dependent oxidoreductase [Oscillospiraceae bacterium]